MEREEITKRALTRVYRRGLWFGIVAGLLLGMLIGFAVRDLLVGDNVIVLPLQQGVEV